ncbi:MAG: TIR domain-containing protein, partial [Cyanothece sp. SIO1E1]|nr:TIR domain-containing protein [Cyanothece sp. SIO1E1]
MHSYQDAFISYGRADSKAFATKLYERLTTQGLKVWFDAEDIPLGVDYQNQIDRDIEQTHNFLFIMSPHAVNSNYCRREIEQALQWHKRIIPLLHVKEISRETWQQRHPTGTNEQWADYQSQGLHFGSNQNPNLHPAIAKINWVPFVEGIDDFETSLAQLLAIFERHQDYVHQHTTWLTQALTWQRQQQQSRYLLIAEERQQAEAWLKVRFKHEQPPCTPTDLHCEFICESIKNANNLMTQVFLSHAESDRAITEKLRQTLMRESFTIWTHRTDIKTGTEFQAEINQGIEEADNVVYLISSDSLASAYCQQEINYALSLNKRIIPLLIESIDLKQMSSALRSLQFIDFTGTQDEAQYHTSANKLLNVLNQDAPYYQQHKILLAKALKWQRQNRNPSILLRGYNLRQAEAWLKVTQQRVQHSPLELQAEFINASLQQPAESSLDVFVSYSRTDSDFARRLNQALQIQGKTTWFDQESITPGTDFQQEIYRGIESSDNFLFILSPSSVNSPYCADEVEYAVKSSRRIVTVLHRPMETATLPPALAEIQWIDFNQQGGDFYASFGELVRTLDTDREYVHSHTKWSQRAMEWRQKGSNSDLLLRGSEFSIADSWLQEAEDWLLKAEKQHKQPPVTELQRAFITASKEAIEAAIRREQRQKVILQSLLGAVSIALVIAVGASVIAFKQSQAAVRSQISALSQASSARFALNQNSFEALLKALEAGKHLKHTTWLKKDPKLQADVITALGQAVYWVTERNRLSGHQDIVQNAGFSPDGQMIVTASYDKTAKLWHQDGSLIRTLEGHSDLVFYASFSPDSQRIATASYDQTVKLWDREGRLLRTLAGHDDLVTSVIFSPDGQMMATASDDQTVKLWHANGTLIKTLTGHDGGVQSISFSPDSQVLATVSLDQTAKLWHRDGNLLRTLSGHTDGVLSVSFSPDGQTLATASLDKTIRIWNWRQGISQLTLTGHTTDVTSVSFSPDGRTLATASADNTIRLWNRNGEPVKILAGHGGRINNVSFSPDGMMLVSSSDDRTARLWQLSSTWQTQITEHGNWVMGVSFSPNGRLLASASNDETARLWSWDGTLLQTLKGHGTWVNSVSFSPDGQVLASAGGDHTVKLWSQDGKLLQTLMGHSSLVYSVSFSSDEQMMATASQDGTVRLWHRDGEQLTMLTGHRDAVYSVDFSPDSQMMATASQDGTAILWARDGKQLHRLMHSGPVYNVSFSPDGQIIATAGQDNDVTLWTRDGKQLHTLTGHNAGVNSVSFSPQSPTIATASDDNTVKLWHQN